MAHDEAASTLFRENHWLKAGKMGKLITVVGNLGAGKTTITQILCNKGSFVPYWEKPEERPFQAYFAKDLKKWALANQMDFLLYRCRQELIARQNDEIAVMDGGFDQDFHVFTKNLYRKGYLAPDEFSFCEYFYQYARMILPAPDIIIRIMIDMPTLMKRRESRERKTVDLLFNPQEFTDLEGLLDEWLKGEKSSPVIQFTFEKDIPCYTHEIEELIRQINRMLRAN